MQEPDGRPILVAFAGAFCGSFALAIAWMTGELLAAELALGMTTFCAAQFVIVTARD